MMYDVRIADETDPKVMLYGFEMMTDPKAKLQVRRREEEVEM